MGEERDPVAALEEDLAALAAADADLERDAEAAERTRIERSGIALPDRLRAAAGPVRLGVLGGGVLAGVVVEVGAESVLLRPPVLRHPPAAGHPVEHLVLLDAVVEVDGLTRGAAGPGGRLPRRSTASLLRAWCRDRAPVSVALRDGSVRTGLAGAAYADHLDLRTASGTRALPYRALAAVSR